MAESSRGLPRLASNASHTDDKAGRTIVMAAQASNDAERNSNDGDDDGEYAHTSRHYRTYRRRYYGLAQLGLLNIIVSWDWLTFAAVSNLAAEYFDTTESAVNWLSTAILFAFLVASPATIWVLNRLGPKHSICAASVLVLVGNWIRYGGARTGDHGSFGIVMLGQILIGLAQPFVLAAPSFYANLWFSDRGRVSAIAVASLANPLGAALGQLIGPFWATTASQVPQMVLYTAIISSLASLPAPFLPKAPPTPPSAMAAAENLDLVRGFNELRRNALFWLIFIPFSVYVGFFNAFSTLINQIFVPYGFSTSDAGIAGALLIFVGLASAAIISPVIDRTKAYVMTIKILVPLIAIGYTIIIFMPQTRSVAGPYLICALLGAANFGLLPCALEFMAIVTHPVSPEVSSTIAWAGGQLLGGIFIIIMTALGSSSGSGWDGQPSGSFIRALIFEGVIAWIAVPFALVLGVWKFTGVQTRLINLGIC